VGYSVLLDIIGSAITGGLLLLTLLSFNAQNAENKRMFRDQIVAQENLVQIVRVLEEDMRRIGYCTVKSNMSVPIVTLAAAESVQFKTDLPQVDAFGSVDQEGNGAVDVITYGLGRSMTETSNPRDRFFYRRENSGVNGGANLGVTTFDVRYFRVNNSNKTVELKRPVTTDSLSLITFIEITVRVENPNPINPIVASDSLIARTPMNWKTMLFEIKNFGKGAMPS
jgi:hypothetical protein